jgi:hypothetical protein
MAALIIGGVTVKVANFRRLPAERGGGGLRRTVNGQLRGRSDWVKRAWAADLIALTSSELTTMLAQMDPDVSETVSGDEIGSSVTARVEVGEIEHVRVGGAVGYYAAPVTIREV